MPCPTHAASAAMILCSRYLRMFNGRLLSWVALVIACLFFEPVLGQTQVPVGEFAHSLADSDAPRERNLVGIILALLVLQTLLILGLQHSRVKYKRAKQSLKRSQHALEQRVIERTNELRSINNKLYYEIAQHEITEERLEETQTYLQSVINSMPSILIAVTREGSVTHWNAAAEQAIGIPAEEAVGQNLAELAPDLHIDLEMIHNAIDQGVAQAKEAIRHEHEGQVVYTDLVIYPLRGEGLSGAVIRIDDVTTRVRFENMMIQNEKMLSLGELAAGMAHEINNPLNAILHAVQNIYRRTRPGLPANDTVAGELGINMKQLQNYLEARGVYRFLDSIKEAGERSAHIVTNMLEFSRRSTRQHQLVDIAKLLEHVLELSHRSFERTGVEPGAIKVETEIQPDLPPVPCSAVEIEQVLLNIIRNAAQAFDDDKRADRPEPKITLRAFADEGVLRIQIADNGPGIPESAQPHLFEPFYTTKEVGKGTGLGLSVSYFIIREHHGGQIEVDSRLGEGATFTIGLPLQKAS